MSVVSTDLPAFDDPARRPSGLWRSMLYGQLIGGLVMGIVGLGLELVPIAGGLGYGSLFLPWRIDGLWALVGAVGWCSLATALMTFCVRHVLSHGGVARPRFAWVALSVGVADYGAMLLTRSGGGRIAIAAVGAPLLLGVLGYRRDGLPRAWPVRCGRWTTVAGLIALALLALSYSVPHAFAIDGGTSVSATAVHRVSVGRPVTLTFSSNGPLVATRLRGVSIVGPGTSALRVRSLGATLDEVGPPWQRPTGLPFDIPSRRMLWMTMRVTLRSCPRTPIEIDRLTLRYRTMGFDTGMSLGLRAPIRFGCSG